MLENGQAILGQRVLSWCMPQKGTMSSPDFTLRVVHLTSKGKTSTADQSPWRPSLHVATPILQCRSVDLDVLCLIYTSVSRVFLMQDYELTFQPLQAGQVTGCIMFRDQQSGHFTWYTVDCPAANRR
eukprot:783661-Amphidinium_carterae.2